MQKKKITLPPRTLFLITCCALVIFFGISSILIINGMIKNKDTEIANLQTAISIQNELIPLQTAIQSRAGKEGSLFKEGPERLHDLRLNGNIDALHSIFSLIAKDCDLDIEGVIPDPATLNANGDQISVTLIMHGHFKKLRKALIMLGTLPFIMDIEDISVSAIPESRRFILNLLISLN